MSGDSALELDGDVAQPDRLVPGIEERPGNDADRVREVDDPSAVGSELTGTLRHLQHHGHRPHRLGEPAGAGRLLADTATRRRDRLVAQARRLAPDAELDDDRRRCVERAVELAGEAEGAGEALALQNPCGQTAHDLESLRIDVVKHQVAYLEALAFAHQS